MKIEEHKELQQFTTLRVPAQARFFVDVQNEQDLFVVVTSELTKEWPVFILGGGSNILFVHDYTGLVVHMNMLGIEVIEETDDEVLVSVKAGENWHDFVMHAVAKGWCGIENLVMIPGTVGAAPVQNIAAYGQNFVSVFHSLEAYEIGTGVIKTFLPKECELGYRDSIFKRELRGKYIISTVNIRLSKQSQLETSYFSQMRHNDSIKSELQTIAQEPYTAKDVAQAVMNIRSRKLPDVSLVPSAGSIFLNPVVSKKQLNDLLKKIPELQYYPVNDLTYEQLQDPVFEAADHVKVAAGQMLDVLGWTDRVIGNCRMHPKHALVATHNGKATGEEMYEFITTVQKDFKDHYNLDLHTEISIIT